MHLVPLHARFLSGTLPGPGDAKMRKTRPPVLKLFGLRGETDKSLVMTHTVKQRDAVPTASLAPLRQSWVTSLGLSFLICKQGTNSTHLPSLKELP